jgi:hypothetical protein
MGFDCDNAAFEEDPKWEISRILREIAARIDADEDFRKGRDIRDINGNTVGQFILVAKRRK